MKNQKKLIAIFAAVLSFYWADATCQKLRVLEDTKLISYDTTITFSGMTSEQLFDKTKGWFVDYFRDASKVIRGENKPDLIKGTFIGTYVGQYGTKQDLGSDITVRIKNETITIRIDRFTDGGSSLESYGLKMDHITLRPSYRKTFEDIELQISEMTRKLSNHIKS
jgi:hypothetical protein